LTDHPGSRSAGSGLHFGALPAGYPLGQYRFQSGLGGGGFGITYRAVDERSWVRRQAQASLSDDNMRTLRNAPMPHAAAVCAARRSAARASRRVESRVGSGEFASFMISGVSVQPSTTASQPSPFIRPMTC